MRRIFTVNRCIFCTVITVIDKHNVIPEFKVRRIKLVSSCDGIIKNDLETLRKCSKDVYPNIYFLFKILLCMCLLQLLNGVFQHLKQLKSYCKNSMNEVYFLIFTAIIQNINVFIILRDVVMDSRYYQSIGQLK